MTSPEKPTLESSEVPPCVSRRGFLLASGAGAVTMLLGDLFPGRVLAQDEGRMVQFAGYPRKRIASLSRMVDDTPVEFLYPDEGPHSISMLLKLGRPAGGGLGPGQDLVAFNALCTHQGGLLRNAYNAEHKAAGPCPIHLTTFDLSRHGMVIAGHATQELPQVVLDLDGDDVFAVGIIGLIYGYPSNLAFVKET